MKQQLARIARILLLAALIPLHSYAASPQSYDWTGTINKTIPVAIWFEIQDGLLVGETVYTKTKAKTPIRLLGQVLDDGRLSINEMLPNGQISGYIVGKIDNGRFTGTWSSLTKIKEVKGRYVFIDGKEYAIQLSPSDYRHKPYQWDYQPDKVGGVYRYNYGKLAGNGQIDISNPSRGDGELTFRISNVVGAPSFNMATVPASEAGHEKGRLVHGRVVNEQDDSCAFEMRFYNGFVSVRYLPERRCSSYFGARAGVDGLYLKQ